MSLEYDLAPDEGEEFDDDEDAEGEYEEEPTGEEIHARAYRHPKTADVPSEYLINEGMSDEVIAGRCVAFLKWAGRPDKIPADLETLRTVKRRAHPLYGVWTGIKWRTTNPNADDFASYGGRGITVCDTWKDSFEAFVRDVGERPSKFHQLDRIDVHGHYEPGNCRWVTPWFNTCNRRRTVRVDFGGESVPLSALALLAGRGAKGAGDRVLEREWDVRRALFAPKVSEEERGRLGAAVLAKPLTFQDVTRSQSEWSRHLGLGANYIARRISECGESPEQALAAAFALSEHRKATGEGTVYIRRWARKPSATQARMPLAA